MSRVDSLPDAPSRTSGAVWRGAYLVPEAVARAGLWLEWESGERSALPTPAGLDQRAAPVSAPGAGRRASRAERSSTARCWPSAAPAGPRRPSRPQARVASEALRALDALELRGTELEAARRGAGRASATRLAEQARVLEAQVPRDEHQRRALADALAAAAAARRQTREWRLRMRAAEVARTSDAVRLRVLEARETSGAPLRAEQREARRGAGGRARAGGRS